MAAQNRSRRFATKAEGALTAAIEVYNKPVFPYREETFAILALNAWELLLKARILSLSRGDPRSLYVYDYLRKKDGSASRVKRVRKNRAGNSHTIGLGQAVVKLDEFGTPLSPPVKANLDALTAIRDNAVHYILAGPALAKDVLEVGSAAVRNFMHLSRSWLGLDFAGKPLLLMPIGFVGDTSVELIHVGSDESNLLSYLRGLSKDCPPVDDLHVSLHMDVSIRRRGEAGTPTVRVSRDDPHALSIVLSEEDMRQQFPWSYDLLLSKLHDRYADFKVNAAFHEKRKAIVVLQIRARTRFLDSQKPSSGYKVFYSPNIVFDFDSHYTLRTASAELPATAG